jgi:hypothetical protein
LIGELQPLDVREPVATIAISDIVDNRNDVIAEVGRPVVIDEDAIVHGIA